MGPCASHRDYLFFHHENNRALRVGDWKLVSKRPDTNSYALYNLKTDRSEQIDVAGKESRRVAALARRWKQLEDSFRVVAGPLDALQPRRRNPQR